MPNRLRNISHTHLHLIIAAATVVCFAATKALLTILANTPELRIGAFVLACVVALGLSRLKTRDLPFAPRTILRGIAALFALYLILAKPSVLLHNPTPLLAFEIVSYHWVAPVLGLLSIWRAAWALPVLVSALWQKALIANLLATTISLTDYMPVLEFGMMLVIGSIIFYLGQRRFTSWQKMPDKKELHLLDAVMLTAVAAHFSNYLYSGVQKILISDPWWQWVPDNPTYYLTLAALEIGAAPISLFSESTIREFLNFQISQTVLLNGTLLFLQLAAVIAIIRIRWAAIMTLMYDVTHVVIFIATGIFFYKWIWLNLLIAFTLATMTTKRIPHDIKIWLVSVVILAPQVYFVAFLGWFDTPSFNDEYVEALTDDGKSYRVPSNYFLSASITAGQQRLIRTKSGHFPTDAYGSLAITRLTPANFVNTRECALPPESESGISNSPERPRLTWFLRNHHAYILDNLQTDGTIRYDLFPHHIFSMPWEYYEFNALDKSRITSYRYVVESKCLDFSSSKLTSKSLLRGEFDVSLR